MRALLAKQRTGDTSKMATFCIPQCKTIFRACGGKHTKPYQKSAYPSSSPLLHGAAVPLLMPRNHRYAERDFASSKSMACFEKGPFRTLRSPVNLRPKTSRYNDRDLTSSEIAIGRIYEAAHLAEARIELLSGGVSMW